MSTGFFITGTDTNVGKTWTSIALMRTLQRQGLTVTGMKPVAAGCDWLDGRWKNQDALLLQEYSSLLMEYELVNPYAFQLSVSPHIACGNQHVSMDVILQAYQALKPSSGRVVVEGAGGWLSPLSQDLDNAGLAVALQLPVILVVGMRLGCINHALLTYLAIKSSRVKLAGWVAVSVDSKMQGFQANLDFLQSRIHEPCFGVLPFLENPDYDLLAASIKFSI